MAPQAKPWFRKQTGWWMVQIRGRQVKLIAGRANRKAAEKKVLELLLETSHNQEPESSEHTVASIIDLYLTTQQAKLGSRTFQEKRFYLQAFAEHVGWRPITGCLPFHLSSWLDKNSQWRSDWTRSTVVAIVQRPFNWAARQGLIAKNPFTGVTHPAGEPRRPMTGDEFQALLRAASGSYGKLRRPSPGARFRQVLIALRLTGCRPSELASLRWSDIDLNRGEIVLRVHKTIRLRRDKKPRVIPLHPVMVRLLISIRRTSMSEYVFTTFRGTPWNRSSLSLRVQRARAKAGISSDVTLYGIRHQFGTRAIVNGVDIKTLAELMGHTSTKMTEHYLHLAGERAHLAAAMIRATARSQGS